MRIRSVKPEFFSEKRISILGPWERLLLIGLWCYADRVGTFDPDPKVIKRTLFSWDNDVKERHIRQWIKKLEKHQFIICTRCVYTTYFEKSVQQNNILCRINGFDASYNVGKTERVKYHIVSEQPLNAPPETQDIGDRSKDLGPTVGGPKDLGLRKKEENPKSRAPDSGAPNGDPIGPEEEKKTKYSPPRPAGPSPIAPPPPTKEEAQAFVKKIYERFGSKK